MVLTSAQRRKFVELLHDLIVDHRLDRALRRSAEYAVTLPMLSDEVVDEIIEKEMDLERLLFYLEQDNSIPTVSFQLLWGWAHSEIWIERRREDRANLMKRGAQVSLTDRLKREDLEAWALYHGVSIWLDVPLATFTGMRDYMGHLTQFSQDGATLWMGVGDVLDGARRFRLKHTLERWFISTARNKLEHLALGVVKEHSRAHKLVEMAPEMKPHHEKLAPMLTRALAQLEQQLEDCAPRPTNLTPRQHRLEASPLWDKIVDWRVTAAECGASEGPTEVSLDLDDESYSISCSCAHNPHRACPIKVSALEHFVDLLRLDGPVRKEHKALLEGVVRTLGTPVWQRRVDHLLSSLEPEPLIPTELSGMPTWLGWCIKGDQYEGLSVYPAIIRGKKRGDGVISKKLQLTEAHLEEVDSERERERMRYWMSISQFHDESQQARFVMELHTHPHVYYHDTTSTPCKVRVEEIKMRMSDLGDVLQMKFYAGEHEFSDYDLRDMYAPLERYGYIITKFRVNRQGGELVFYRASRKVLAVMKAANERALKLPRQAAGYLLEGISKRPEAHQALELDEGLRGERIDAEHGLVLRLSFIAGVLNLSLRAEPLKGGATHHPGDGPEVVYAIREDRSVFAERDLVDEIARAKNVIKALDLEYDHGALMSWDESDPEVALELIDQIRDFERSSESVRIAWDSAAPRVVGTARSSQLYLKVSLKQKLFEIGGQLKIDGESVPVMQLLDAAREQRRWIEIKQDHWVKLDDALNKNLERLSNMGDGELGSVSTLATPALLDMVEQGIEIEGPPRWLDMVEEIERAHTMEVTIPETLEATLRPYQERGVAWMCRLAQWAPGCCLADDMGLGKTVQALALLLQRAPGGPALVVAPTSLGFNWAREAGKFAPSLKIERMRSGSDCKKLATIIEAAKAKKAQPVVVVVSYDLVARNLDHFKSILWNTMVLDEAQAIKNSATNRARAMHAIDADFKLGLTGTPLENNTGELWSLMRALVPGLLGSQEKFRKRYQIPIERDGDRAARATLASLISPFILRRVKSEVASDLPERTDIRVDIELGSGEKKLYEELRRSVLAKISGTDQSDMGESKRFEILAAITRLRQAACHPKLYHPKSRVKSSKLEVLRERLESIAEEGYRALVFSQFTSLLKLVQEDLEGSGLRIAYLDGSMSAKKREEVVEAFQAGHYDVFLLSIKAGGVGLNLTAANTVFLLDPWWNPAVEDQATDRAHRIGQKEPVTVYRLVAQGTIEEAIYELHAEKRSLLDGVLSEAGSVKKALSPEELRALIGT